MWSGKRRRAFRETNPHSHPDAGDCLDQHCSVIGPQQDAAGNSIVAARVILVVIFDERSSLGLVRLRVKRATNEMNSIFTSIDSKSEQDSGMSLDSPFAEITEDDIDALFR